MLLILLYSGRLDVAVCFVYQYSAFDFVFFFFFLFFARVNRMLSAATAARLPLSGTFLGAPRSELCPWDREMASIDAVVL